MKLNDELRNAIFAIFCLACWFASGLCACGWSGSDTNFLFGYHSHRVIDKSLTPLGVGFFCAE